LNIDFDKEPDEDIVNPIIPVHAVPALERQDTWSIKRGWKQHIRDYLSDGDKCNTVLEKVTHLATWER
jgi:hypothetical protein